MYYHPLVPCLDHAARYEALRRRAKRRRVALLCTSHVLALVLGAALNHLLRLV